MDGDAAKAHCLNCPEAVLDFPFGPDVYVFKIRGRMFATLAWTDGVARMNLKCDPDQAVFLRTMFDAVGPGYHMNKTHWNTVLLDGSVPGGELARMIEHSYGLVVRKLPRAQRTALEVRYGNDRLYR